MEQGASKFVTANHFYDDISGFNLVNNIPAILQLITITQNVRGIQINNIPAISSKLSILLPNPFIVVFPVMR
jgi:hypothetical protein